jgi:hypothetical protein
MKISLLSPRKLAHAFILTAAALSAPSVHAALTYSDGDVFIGFRKDGVATTLVANLGSITKFLPPGKGGTWNGNPFNVQFGLVPNTVNAVTSLAPDLVANFGANWAVNSTNQTSVRWAVVGITSNAVDNAPINGYNNRTAFLTRPRLTLNTPSTLGSGSNNSFGSEFNAFAVGIGGGSYLGLTNTANSSVAAIGTGSDANNWGTRIGGNASFGFGSNRNVEQFLSGANQGPTDSVLDLWIAPTSGSSLGNARVLAGGSFVLNTDGSLTYGAYPFAVAPVPEPGTLTFGLGLIGALGLRRKRQAAQALA